VWSGPYCIPERAAINHWGAIGEDGTEELTFEPVVYAFDEKLYAEAQQVVAHNQTPTLAIHDFRVSPMTITEPFRPRQHPIDRAAAGHNVRRWLINANVLIIVGLGAFVLWTYVRRRQRESRR
jgi:hypothetical protein